MVLANKYRDKKIKQEHTIIDNIFPLLEEIAEFPYKKYYSR